MNIFRGIPSYQEEPDASVMKLGGPFRHSPNGRDMEWLSAEPPHQLTRNEGCAISTNSLFTQSQEQTSPHQAPQFNGVVSYIDEEGAQNQPFLFVDMGDFSVGKESQHWPLCRKRNVLVYNLSRGQPVFRPTERSLNLDIVRHLLQAFDTPNIDLFATLENKKLQLYCSPFQMEGAFATDALSVN